MPADFRDFLRTRKLRLWEKNDPRALAVRRLGPKGDATHEVYATNVEKADAETAANTVICLIHQASYLLDQQIRRLEQAFLEEGGLRERMTRARLQERANRKPMP